MGFVLVPDHCLPFLHLLIILKSWLDFKTKYYNNGRVFIRAIIIACSDNVLFDSSRKCILYAFVIYDHDLFSILLSAEIIYSLQLIKEN